MTHWTHETRTARKKHRCEMCLRVIDPGELYRRSAGMDGSTAWTWKECLHCAQLIRYVVWLESEEEYGPDLFAEWEPETIEHLRLKVLATRLRWRRTDGTLYPTPVVVEFYMQDTLRRVIEIYPGREAA